MGFGVGVKQPIAEGVVVQSLHAAAVIDLADVIADVGAHFKYRHDDVVHPFDCLAGKIVVCVAGVLHRVSHRVGDGAQVVGRIVVGALRELAVGVVCVEGGFGSGHHWCRPIDHTRHQWCSHIEGGDTRYVRAGSLSMVDTWALALYVKVVSRATGFPSASKPVSPIRSGLWSA